MFHINIDNLENLNSEILKDLSDQELKEVSGGEGLLGGIVLTYELARFGYEIVQGYVNIGLNARAAGLGESFLEAVRGGNLGA